MEDNKKSKAQLISELTELRRQKSEFEKSSEKYFQNIIDSSINMIVTVDVNRNIVEFNKAACETFGYTKEEIIGKHVGILYADQDAGRDIAAQIITKGVFVGEIQNVRKNGEIFSCYLSASIILDDNGKSIGTVGSSIDITERKKAREALQLTQFANDHSPEAAYWMGADAKFIYVNEASCRALGYSKEELLGMTVHDIGPDFSKEVWPAHWEDLRRRKSFVIETTHQKKNGELFPVEITENYLKFAGKEYNCAFARDITNRKKAIESLISEKKKTQRYLDVAKVMFIVVDSKGILTFINKKGCEILGYEENEIIGKNWFDTFLPKSFRKKTKDDFCKSITKNQKPAEYHENYILCRNGKERLMAWYNSVICDKDGNIESIYCSGEDITERKKAEQALIESEERYRTLVERANDGIVIVQDGRIEFINQKFFELFGYSFEEMFGKSFLEYICPEERSYAEEIHKKRLKGDDAPETYEVSALHKDGRKIGIEISSGLISFKGKPASLAFIRDITERKQNEIERSKASKLESIGTLAGGIAHDFNNILAAILGNASLAKICVDNKSEVLELLNEVENASLRAKGLTQQLLTFSKGGTPIVETTEILLLIHDITQFSLKGSNVQYSIQVIPNLGLVNVDREQIRQAIGNLIKNAQQSMPDGGTINITANNVVIGSENRMSLKKGDYVKISIEDIGHGIPEEHLTKIFDPYFSIKQNGSGLGLATTYSIIDRHNGHINVESKVGVGTTVKIYLPAISTKKKVKRNDVEKSTAVDFRILVMDDDEMVRKYMTKVLKNLGHRVEMAVDGDEALKIYKKALNTDNSIDVVIMDLTIPGGMGGKETIKKLLEIDPDAKAIVYSGYSNDPVISDYRKYGFKGFVLKPFVLSDLEKVLNEINN